MCEYPVEAGIHSDTLLKRCNMIVIKKPYVSVDGPNARLVSDLEVDGIVRPLWVEVAASFEWYLVPERSDAFLMGLLYWAVQNGHDIVCEAPVDGDLLYGIQNLLIPTLTPSGKQTKRITVTAVAAKDMLKNAGAVGADITCGVDSLYTIYTHSGNKGEALELTRLLYNTIGAHGVNDATADLYDARLKTAKAFAADYGLPFIALDTNLMEIVTAKAARNNLYAHCFIASALGHLFKHYFISGHLDDSPNKPIQFPRGMDSSDYSHLLLRVFSTRSLSFSRGSGTASPLERVKVIFQNPLTFQYLNVCVSAVRNCTECTKCVRALLRLEALGLVEKCDTVFNLEVWHRERFKHIFKMFLDALKRKPYALELVPHYRLELFMIAVSGIAIVVGLVAFMMRVLGE